jgi:Pectate lyase superfamily protein
MLKETSRLSRRSFVEHSAMAAGVLGAAGLASSRAHGAETDQTPELSATLGVNARLHGAKGDGKTDDTKALQTALDAAETKGPICYVPAGLYRLDGALTVPPGVTLCGASGGVPHSEHPIGTVLLAYGGRGQAESEPLITLKPNGVVRNLIIHYPEQTLPEVAAYPWSIRVDGELCQVLDVTLTNPYQAIDVGSKWNELHLIRNVFACPLKTGVYIDQCTDIGRIENVHFNPNFWTRMALKPGFPGGDIQAYLEKNLVGFKIGKTDWEFISNSFVIFPKIGFHFNDFGHGPGNVVVTQSGSDICPVAVRVERSQPHAGVEFANGQFMGTLEVGPENRGPVKLANCGFWGTAATQEHVRHAGPSSLVLTACHFTGWDHAGKGDPCIRAAGGRLVVNGCEFRDDGKCAVVLEKGLKAATILGCTLRGPQAVVDQSGADVQIGLNTSH